MIRSAIYRRVERTCVDEELVGEAGMVHVVDCGGENGGHDFQIGKDRLSRRGATIGGGVKLAGGETKERERGKKNGLRLHTDAYTLARTHNRSVYK